LRSWVAGVYTASNATLGGFEGANGDEAAAERSFATSILPLFAMATAFTVALGVVIGLTIPFAIGMSTVMTFLIPIVFQLLQVGGSVSGAPSWLTGLDSYISQSISTLVAGAVWVIGALMNATQVLSISAITTFFDPSSRGDLFLFAALVGTGSAGGSNTALQAALLGLKPENPAQLTLGRGQNAEAQQDAALAALFSILAILFVAGEAILILVSAAQGSSSYVEFGEVMLAGLAVVLGIIGLIYGYYSEVAMPGDQVIPGAAELSDGGVIGGIVGVVAGVNDIASIVAG
jgi:hypothetical protein